MLFVGMLAAVYSSIFLATPVLVDLKEAEPQVQAAQAAGAGPAGRRRRAASASARRSRRAGPPRPAAAKAAPAKAAAGARPRTRRARTTRWPAPRRAPVPARRRASGPAPAKPGGQAGRCPLRRPQTLSARQRRSVDGVAPIWRGALRHVSARRACHDGARVTADPRSAELIASHVIDVPGLPQAGHRLQGPEPAVRRRRAFRAGRSTRSSRHCPGALRRGGRHRGPRVPAGRRRSAYATGVGRRAGPQGRQAAPGDPRRVLRPGVRHGHARGARGRLRRRASGCSWSTTCSPPAAPRRRRCRWSSGPAARSPGSRCCWSWRSWAAGRRWPAGRCTPCSPSETRRSVPEPRRSDRRESAEARSASMYPVRWSFRARACRPGTAPARE